MLNIRQLGKSNHGHLRRLLQHANLCVNDLARPEVQLFSVDFTGKPVGYFGFEVYGEAALFRSMIVVPGFRNHGYGTLIWQEAKGILQGQGVKTVYLLTNTAAAFFARQGFAAVPRGSVPADIAATAEFKEFCPADSVCMKITI